MEISVTMPAMPPHASRKKRNGLFRFFGEKGIKNSDSRPKAIKSPRGAALTMRGKKARLPGGQMQQPVFWGNPGKAPRENRESALECRPVIRARGGAGPPKGTGIRKSEL